MPGTLKALDPGFVNQGLSASEANIPISLLLDRIPLFGPLLTLNGLGKAFRSPGGGSRAVPMPPLAGRPKSIEPGPFPGHRYFNETTHPTLQGGFLVFLSVFKSVSFPATYIYLRGKSYLDLAPYCTRIPGRRGPRCRSHP